MEVAAKIYSGIIFPDILPETDPHLSDLQKAMLDATPDCIKVLSADGRLVTMNRAGCLALGVPEDSEFGMPWLPLLPESVHELGTAALRQASDGQSARFPGQSQSQDGTRYWDNLLTPIRDESGRVLSILCVSRDVTTKTQLERELEAAVDREKLLSREMQHRIKNLFAVASGLISIAEKEAREPSADGLAKILRQKLDALTRASDALFAGQEADHGTNEIDLRALISSVLRPYGDQCSATGTSFNVGRGIMTTLALFLHELATNSVKYGALGSEGGIVSVQWNAGEYGLDLSWIESGGPTISASPQRQGFGSEMVHRIVQSAGGKVNRTWRSEGLITELHLPHSALP